MVIKIMLCAFFLKFFLLSNAMSSDVCFCDLNNYSGINTTISNEIDDYSINDFKECSLCPKNYIGKIKNSLSESKYQEVLMGIVGLKNHILHTNTTLKKGEVKTLDMIAMDMKLILSRSRISVYCAIKLSELRKESFLKQENSSFYDSESIFNDSFSDFKSTCSSSINF